MSLKTKLSNIMIATKQQYALEHASELLKIERQALWANPRPHIKKLKNGIWECRGARTWQNSNEGFGGLFTGKGPTPRLAYSHWLRQVNQYYLNCHNPQWSYSTTLDSAA